MRCKSPLPVTTPLRRTAEIRLASPQPVPPFLPTGRLPKKGGESAYLESQAGTLPVGTVGRWHSASVLQRQLRRTSHISKAQQQRPFVTRNLSVQRHRDDDDDVGSNADRALSKHKVLLLNKGPRRKEASQNTAWPAPFFAPPRAAKGGGGPRFFFFSIPRAESLSRRTQGSTPDANERGGCLGWGVRESTPNCTSEQPPQNASSRARKASQRARSSSSTMAKHYDFFLSPVHRLLSS